MMRTLVAIIAAASALALSACAGDSGSRTGTASRSGTAAGSGSTTGSGTATGTAEEQKRTPGSSSDSSSGTFPKSSTY